jgi:hypothetical protein
LCTGTSVPRSAKLLRAAVERRHEDQALVFRLGPINSMRAAPRRA